MMRDRIAGFLSRLFLRVAVVDLYSTIEVLLFNSAHELTKPVGEQDPDIAELACVYERLTGWNAFEEIRRDEEMLRDQ